MCEKSCFFVRLSVAGSIDSLSDKDENTVMSSIFRTRKFLERTHRNISSGISHLSTRARKLPSIWINVVLVQWPYVRGIEWHASRFDYSRLELAMYEGTIGTNANKRAIHIHGSARERERERKKRTEDDYTVRVRTTVNATRFLMCKEKDSAI